MISVDKSSATISDAQRAFIERQSIFFVATAPLAGDGHVNCSPKGLDTLRVLGSSALAYLDHAGSGVETIAHLRENGRIVVMVCAFDGPPKIVRCYGRGTVLEPDSAGFAELAPEFDVGPGTRAIIRIDVDRAVDSCGFGVPLMAFESERPQLRAWADRKGQTGIADYIRENNAESIDALPGMMP